MLRPLLVVLAFVVPCVSAQSVVLAPGDDVQAAIDASVDGDVLMLLPGTHSGDLDFGGRQIHLVGSGPHTLIRGTGTGPVVRFENGETPLSVLDSVTVTGGVASQGGGVRIDGASPTIVRCTIRDNQASSQGSGVWIGGGGQPLLFNNVIAYNTRSAGDPHGVQIVSAAPVLVNNTVVRHDSNGIFLSGSSAAVILHNVIAWNGATVGGEVRGRGICDFSGGQASIVANDFHANRRSALLRGGKDWRRIGKFQAKNPEDSRVMSNVDGNPGYLRRPPKMPAKLNCFDLTVCDQRKGRAVDAGLDDALRVDLDGSRNTLGHTGGPFAAGSFRIPTPADGL